KVHGAVRQPRRFRGLIHSGACRQGLFSGTSSTIVRLQAAFHSTLLMCVAASHNVIHCCNVTAPPWAVINAASLWMIEAPCAGTRPRNGTATRIMMIAVSQPCLDRAATKDFWSAC